MEKRKPYTIFEKFKNKLYGYERKAPMPDLYLWPEEEREEIKKTWETGLNKQNRERRSKDRLIYSIIFGVLLIWFLVSFGS